MTDIETLMIMKEAISKIEIKEHRTECDNGLLVELDTDKAIKYLNEKIDVEKSKYGIKT